MGRMGNQGSMMPSRQLLIVGDPALSCGLMEMVLSRLGYVVVCVGCAREAQLALAGGSFALVLIALHLPDLSGLTLARRLRATPGPVGSMPIVLFGDAWDPGRILESCREARLDGYLPKPLSIGRLVSSIRELVHHLPPEAGAPMPPTLPLTLDRLTSFTDGDPQLEHELGALYLATATLYLREMRAALVAGGDWSRTAHSLKGASANLGAEEVARLAAAAEHERPTDASLTALERAVMAVRNFFLQRQQDERQTRRVAMAGPG